MPELPDVEVLGRYFESTALHKQIDSVDVRSDYVLKGISRNELKDHLIGKAFGMVKRHGKFLFANFEDSNEWLVLHFGMTGDLKYYKKEDREPEYDLVSIQFENGYQLAYVMTRKLGEVRIINDKQAFIQERELGPDVYSDAFTFDKFKELLTGRRGMIKPTLMNQGIMAGIGNVYSDEILFQTGIHPETKVNQLTGEDLRKIYQVMQDVLQTSIDNQAIPDHFPDDYITPLRGEEGASCPKCKGKLKRIVVSGRSSYFCPECQKKPHPK